MSESAFVAQLKAEIEQVLSKLDRAPEIDAAVDPMRHLPMLLRAALKNEIEAADVAAAWVASTPEIEAKLVLARHAGDEARHYQMLEQSMRSLGIDPYNLAPVRFNPLQPPSPVLVFLRKLTTTEERIAAALVAREAMGARRNQQFLQYLEAVGRHDIAQLYREVINPDEERHHRAGCELLARIAVTPEAQERARSAAMRLLQIGDDVREAFLQGTGAGVLPGC
jgi:hypothetical protein